MIDSKKLGETPLTELELGSNDFCIAVAVHLDLGESIANMCILLKAQVDYLTAAQDKGRAIRDRFIQQNAEAMAKNCQEGLTAKPFIRPQRSEMKTFGHVAFEHGVGLRHGRFRVEESSRIH